MKLCNAFLFALVTVFSIPATAKPEKLALDVHAEFAILMNAETGAILYEKNPHAQHYPASITKIVTAICALEKVGDQMDMVITADQECIGTVTEAAIRRSNYTLPHHLLTPCGSHIGIKRGEQFALKDLFYGMMIASGDDAANIVAKHAGGTIPNFIDEMNRYVKSIGCRSTTFCNAHGLHNPKQLTTAYDMALITREAMKNPMFREIVRTPYCTRPKTNKQEPTTLVQTNKLLRRNGRYYYPKAIGVKTGSYSLAKHNLVAAAKDGDRTLIAVQLKVEDGNDMFLDAKKMFEAAFSQPKVQRVLLRKGLQKFALEIAGTDKTIPTYTTEDVCITYYPAEEPSLKFQVAWNKSLNLPVDKGQCIGNFLVLSEEGKILQQVPLLAQDHVKAGWWQRLKQTSNKNSLLIKSLAILSVGSLVALIIFELRRRKTGSQPR